MRARSSLGAHWRDDMQTYYSNDEETTLEIAERLADKLNVGDIVLLRGDLGAGKSVFARGLARGWGVQGHVTSPTFTTMQQYDGARGRFYHFDLYRMDDPEQLFETGLNEYIGGDGLAVIEWPENAELDPEGAYTVRVERAPAGCCVSSGAGGTSDGLSRRITIIAPGEENA